MKDIRIIFFDKVPLVSVDMTGVIYLGEWLLDWYADKYDFDRTRLSLSFSLNSINSPSQKEIEKYSI